MSLLKQGGFFIYPILICSVLLVAIIADRLLVFANLMKTPLIRYDDPERTVQLLRQRLIGLHTILVIAPMLGLIGTIAGLMKSFRLLGESAGSYQPQVISLGVSEALITTATGLIVAVIGAISYNYFTARLDGYVMEYNNALAHANRGDADHE